MEQNAMGCTPLHTICDMYASEHPVPEFFLKCGTAMMEYAASKGQGEENTRPRGYKTPFVLI